MGIVSAAWRQTMTPGTYQFFQYDKTAGTCTRGGTVIVGGQTSYTLAFNTGTKPTVGP